MNFKTVVQILGGGITKTTFLEIKFSHIEFKI